MCFFSLLDFYDKETCCSIPAALKEMSFEAAAWGVIGASGGRLVIPDCNVSLTIPEGALTTHNANHTFYVAVISNHTSKPFLHNQQVKCYCYHYFYYVSSPTPPLASNVLFCRQCPAGTSM